LWCRSDALKPQVVLEVATKDESSAAAASSKLLDEPIEYKLLSLGLPSGKVLSSVIKVVSLCSRDDSAEISPKFFLICKTD
jgi:hypothetical protein